MTKKAVSIIVPIYSDWPSLKDCLKALAETVDLAKHKVMLVNDNGPEADQLEADIKNFIKSRRGFEYYRNSKNLGFVGTCNRAALELDKTGNDMLLLNSDTIPTPGWLDEMISVLNSSSKIATVTPRTNNATLATIPLWSVHQKGISPKKSFALFEKLKSELPRQNEIPTGHGFCLLIRRKLINNFGLFDPVFGKGYGEENDFCQRVIKKGYINVLANHAYVYHLEARSFTAERKARLIETNLKIIWQRYPNYRQDVRNYMAQATTEERVLEKKLGINTAPSKLSQFLSKIWRRLAKP